MNGMNYGLEFFYTFIYSVGEGMHLSLHAHVRSEDNLLKSFFFFFFSFYHVDPEDPTRVIRLQHERLYPLSRLLLSWSPIF